MEHLAPQEVTVMFLALGTLLACAKLFGELARRFHLPSVFGEILAGILLGPTVLGTLLPEIHQYIFPARGASALVIDGVTILAIALFLLVAGIEVDLSTIWRQGRVTLSVALAGIVVPFGLGFTAVRLFPGVLGFAPGDDLLVFAFFMATALSISALPVIAKTLIDLNIYRSDLGVVVIAAAVCNDLVGWLIFAVILGHMGIDGGHGLSLMHTIGLTLGFAIAMLTLVRAMVHRVLPWIQAYVSWPDGVLGFAFTLALLSAAFTEAIGVHAIFGSFLAGVALGNSRHLRESTRTTIEEFVNSFFTPLFFASIGLKVNFLTHFDPLLVMILLAVALTGKVFGGGLGARFAGVSWRESWGIGFGLSAQGTMGIILGLLALQFGVIDQRVFVALVATALTTSVLSGPAMQMVLRLKKPRRFFSFMSAKTFLQPLESSTRKDAIHTLALTIAEAHGLERRDVEGAVLKRERLMATGIGNEVAVPHARLRDLAQPIVALGISPAGIDFDAPDGKPAHFIFLLLTSEDDNGAQLEILADISRTFKDPQLRLETLAELGYTNFIALVKSAGEKS